MRCTVVLCAALVAVSTGARERDLAGYGDRVEDGDWTVALAAALADAPEDSVLNIPAGEYRITAPIDIERSVTLRLFRGARLLGQTSDLFRIRGGGDIVFEGVGGHPELVNRGDVQPDIDDRGIPRSGISSVISLNHIREGETPRLRFQRLRLEGFRCIDGILVDGYAEDRPVLGALEVIDCRLEAGDIHIGHRQSRIDRLVIENSHFTGDARFGIFVASPLPRGAMVRGNILEGVGIRAIQLGGGKANMIADGAVEYVPAATVHENQILGGGHRANIQTSYIQGILVYGHNISIQGNIVRDFNRGVPVPGEPAGHHIPLDDGTFYRGIWRVHEEGAARRRVAGAAIYAKARQGIIANNVCSNSGWRSVIEVKTGGREPFVLVTGNVVDGRSLAIEDSFGFEPSSGRSVWSNNLVFDMPHIAFRIQANMQNSYINNVIHRAPIGFHIRGGAGDAGERVQGNRFVDVATPFMAEGHAAERAERAAPPTLIVPALASLPPPAEEHRGRMAFVQDPDGDRLYICRLRGGVHAWEALAAPDGASVIEAPVPVDWVDVSPNLALNPDQSADGPGPDDPLAALWSAHRSYMEFPAGWGVGLGRDPSHTIDEFSGYDADVFESGTRSLRIGDAGSRVNWQLSQVLPVEPGATYRARARLRRNDEGADARLILDSGDAQVSAGGIESVDRWETLEAVLTTPEGQDRLRLRIHGSRGGDGRKVYVDAVSLHRVEPRED